MLINPGAFAQIPIVYCELINTHYVLYNYILFNNNITFK